MLFNQIPSSDHDSTKTTSLLGIQWDTSTDMLSIKQSTVPDHEVMTKRSVVQFTGAVYDPIGLFFPVILTTKLFIQHLWEENFEWDMRLPEMLRIKWVAVRIELEKISNIQIPQYIETTNQSEHQLHCFVAEWKNREYLEKKIAKYRKKTENPTATDSDQLTAAKI